MQYINERDKGQRRKVLLDFSFPPISSQIYVSSHIPVHSHNKYEFSQPTADGVKLQKCSRDHEEKMKLSVQYVLIQIIKGQITL